MAPAVPRLWLAGLSTSVYDRLPPDVDDDVGTVLTGFSWKPDVPDPVLRPAREYPEWVWTLEARRPGLDDPSVSWDAEDLSLGGGAAGKRERHPGGAARRYHKLQRNAAIKQSNFESRKK